MNITNIINIVRNVKKVCEDYIVLVEITVEHIAKVVNLEVSEVKKILDIQ